VKDRESATGITAYRFMTIPARRTKRVWSVSGTGGSGMDIQLPAAIRAMNVPLWARIRARCIMSTIICGMVDKKNPVNQDKSGG
jgi:hypothetical protein